MRREANTSISEFFPFEVHPFPLRQIQVASNVFFPELPEGDIHLVTNRQLNQLSINTSTFVEELARAHDGVTFNIWVIDECYRKGI